MIGREFGANPRARERACVTQGAFAVLSGYEELVQNAFAHTFYVESV